MAFAVSIAELHIPAARSLKEKRRVIKSLVERIHARYRVSIAETDYHDLHQRAEISIAVVHRNGRELDRLLEAIRRSMDDLPEAVLLSWRPEVIEGPA